eukprot:COSAG01_NODE_679_length_14296_cov_250.437575_8_plen_45_part_00
MFTCWSVLHSRVLVPGVGCDGADVLGDCTSWVQHMHVFKDLRVI